MTYINLFTNKDVIVQMASCSYDAHVLEIIGVLTIGSSIVMLCPEGNMNIDYLSTVLRDKQVSYMQSVPAHLSSIIDFLLEQNCPMLNTLRTIDVGGKNFAPKFTNSVCIL
jgi:hypothetical protein